jgi:2-desacetyl-2-hydroxyethyl bacteriochlorophyllide A dehydrogenase
MIKGPMDLEVQGFEVDPDPGEGKVLVKNRYTAISAGTELSIYTGTNPRVYEPGSWCNYPHVPGYAGIGEVIAVGRDVSALKVGDYVFHHPHHASHDVLDSRYGLYAKVPKELYLPEVALARFAAIVLSGSVRLSRVELGDKMALFGLGIIGQTAAQLFSLAGADVIAFDPVANRRRLAEKVGACVGVYDPVAENARSVISRYQPKGADVVVDATGRSETVMANFGLTRRKGKIVLLGTPFTSFNTDVTQLFRYIHLNWITVIGALERDRVVIPSDDETHSYVEDVAYVLDLIRRGKLNMKDLMSHVLPPSEFKQGYEGLLGKKDEYSAVVIDWARD